MKHVILSGGGVKGLALVGALSELQLDWPPFSEIFFSGASVGSLIAFMLSLDYSLAEIAAIFEQIPASLAFPVHVDLNQLSVLSHDCLRVILRLFLEQRGLDPDIRYRDYPYKDRLGIFLYCTTCTEILYIGPDEATTEQGKHHNLHNLRERPIVDLLLASTAIPMVFPPLLDNDHVIVDGYVSYWFPFFVAHHFPDAFMLLLKQRDYDTCMPYDLGHLSKHMLRTAVCVDHPYFEQFFPHIRCLLIPIPNVNPLDELSDEEKIDLYQSGQCAALTFLREEERRQLEAEKENEKM